jgi:hypothetical protein
VRAVHGGAAHTRATAEAPARRGARRACPTSCRSTRGRRLAGGRAPQVGEVKVYNTIISDAAQLLRGATQAFGATRARLLAENLGEFAPKDVWWRRAATACRAPPSTRRRSTGARGRAGARRARAHQRGLGPLLAGGDALPGRRELAQARNDGIDIERASTTWSFTSYHGQLLSLAVQWGIAIEIERAIKKNASF